MENLSMGLLAVVWQSLVESNSSISRKDFVALSNALFTSLALAPTAVLAQSGVIHRIAIVCETSDEATQGDISRFESRLGGSLLKGGHFSLVDRERLDRIISEQGFSNSAYADPKTAAKLGKIAGAERFLNVNLTANVQADRGAFVTTVADHVSADFTLVDVMTGNILSQGSADGDAQDKLSSGQGDVSTIAIANLRRQAIDFCIDDLVQQLTP